MLRWIYQSSYTFFIHASENNADNDLQFGVHHLSTFTVFIHAGINIDKSVHMLMRGANNIQVGPKLRRIRSAEAAMYH